MDQQEQEIKHVIKALIPTKVEAIGLSIASLVFLTLNSALEYFQALDSINYEQVAINIESVVRELLGVIDKYIGVTFLTLVFWMLIGTLVYSIIWIGGSAITAYKDDVPTTKGIVFPQGYKKSTIMHEAIAKVSMRTAATIILITWLYLFFTKVIPLVISTFSLSSEETIFDMAIEASASVIILASSIFLISVLLRLMLLRSRVFYK